MALCEDLEARKQKTRQTCILLNDACIDKMLTAVSPPASTSTGSGFTPTLTCSTAGRKTSPNSAFHPAIGVQGKLVPQDPNDEPASVLLEKISAARKQYLKGASAKIESLWRP